MSDSGLNRQAAGTRKAVLYLAVIQVMGGTAFVIAGVWAIEKGMTAVGVILICLAILIAIFSVRLHRRIRRLPVQP